MIRDFISLVYSLSLIIVNGKDTRERERERSYKIDSNTKGERPRSKSRKRKENYLKIYIAIKLFFY